MLKLIISNIYELLIILLSKHLSLQLNTLGLLTVSGSLKAASESLVIILIGAEIKKIISPLIRYKLKHGGFFFYLY